MNRYKITDKDIVKAKKYLNKKISTAFLWQTADGNCERILSGGAQSTSIRAGARTLERETGDIEID